MSVSTTATPIASIQHIIRNNPVVPLIMFLVILIVALEIMRPGIVTPFRAGRDGIISAFWIGNLIKFAIPLAILAACQVLTMLTAGIDLSVGVVATVSAFVCATLSSIWGVAPAVLIALLSGLMVGSVNGLGVGLARVHPLIMTLGTGLIATGCLQVYQRLVINAGSEIPVFLTWLGTGRTFSMPNGLYVFIPFACLILWLMHLTGFGRLLFALGSNERAAKLSGVRAWQVYLALYVISGLIAAMAGLLYLGIIRQASLSLANPLLLPSVAAAVIGGTSIFGGRGSFIGAIVGALIIRVLDTMLTLLQMPESVRVALFGAIILAVTAIYVRIIDSK